MTDSTALVISPSGNLYGSEQVLMDYLQSTSMRLTVAVNERGIYLNILRESVSRHKLSGFDPTRIKKFYWKLFIDLARGKYTTVYWNEAGHINYCLLLSRIFPGKKFVVHVRIIEDTHTDRWWIQPGANVSFIAVSAYIRQNLKYRSTLLYDPFPFETTVPTTAKQDPVFRIGIIGRLTFTKGISHFSELFSLIRKSGTGDRYRFVFYGDVSDDVKASDWLQQNSQYPFVTFAGFQKDREVLYRSIDCVMHLSQQEALGRIFLEAINAGKPLVGFNAAGIGEIGQLLGLSDLLVEIGKPESYAPLLWEKLSHIQANFVTIQARIQDAKEKAAAIFAIRQYVHTVDKLITS